MTIIMFTTWRPCLIYLLKYIILICKQYHTYFYTFFTYTNIYAYFLFLVFKCTFFPSFYSFFACGVFLIPNPKWKLSVSLTTLLQCLFFLPTSFLSVCKLSTTLQTLTVDSPIQSQYSLTLVPKHRQSSAPREPVSNATPRRRRSWNKSKSKP